MSQEFLAIAKKAALAGGEVLLRFFRGAIDYEKKADGSLVSKADREAELAVRKVILDAFPDHAIIGEEHGETGRSEWCWHIDPLDGTTNFRNGSSDFAVSVGLSHLGRFILGAIFQPVGNRLYWAERGKGAFCNKERIFVSKVQAHDGLAMIDGSLEGNERVRKRLAFLLQWKKECQHMRMIGSNALQLAHLADGMSIFSFHDYFHTWDIAAGVVIAQEAGAIVTDEKGQEPTLSTTVIVAANSQETHKEAMRIIRRIYL